MTRWGRLFGGRVDLEGNAIELLASVLADLATLISLLEDVSLLELLEDGADDLSGGLSVVRRADSVVLGTAEGVTELGDSNLGTEVDVAGDGSY